MEETDNDLSQAEDLVGGDATSSKTEDSSKTEALVKRGSEIEMSSDLAAAGVGAVASTSVKSEAASSADEGQDKDEAMVKTSSNIHRLGFSTFLDPEFLQNVKLKETIKLYWCRNFKRKWHGGFVEKAALYVVSKASA